MSWGDESVDFDQVTALAYWWEKVAIKGMDFGIAYRVELYTGEKRTRVFFGGREDFFRGLFEEIVAALHVRVVSRLAREVLARVDRGEEVEVARLRFSREGLSRKGRIFRLKQVPWSTVVELRPMPDPWGVQILASDSQGGKRVIGSGAFRFRNGALVPTLVRACVDRYAAG